MKKKPSNKVTETAKTEALKSFQENPTDQELTTNQGLRINDDQNSLKAGNRGPSLLEDFHLREKITHFDHERIPERVVHARGSAAHGFFQVYKPLTSLTQAKFLQEPNRKTPVFVRFSTVAGSRGSTDLARDVRGFAVKFYTDEGNFDLVGNNMPVFFIQDALKFPDLIHAVKPEPNNEMPQAASAHDTFWDFISLMPESTHMVMWLMSDRALPRSFRMMEGFGVHTFRFINEQGKSRFIKFHWKPVQGVHSIVWDEAQKISGQDPDFHRRDLWEAIETGNFPEWELGIQVVEEEDENKFDFDLLDPTKLIPEELVPVQIIGKMTLNRNPENFFAETEQVAFHPGHVVSGIDFSNDPLLQGRLFSYTDTQLTRLGGPNFHEIPINRPIAPVHNNQRDGLMRQTISTGVTSYQPNSIGGGCPFQAGRDMGGFVSFAQKMMGNKERSRSDKFFDHFSQAKLFFNSQTPPEKDHMVSALRFELGKVERPEIRTRMLGVLSLVDQTLAESVATGLGMTVPKQPASPINHAVPADGNPKDFEPKPSKRTIGESKALSIIKNPKGGIKTRKVAFLAADGFDGAAFAAMKQALLAQGAQVKLVAPHLGFLESSKGEKQKVDFSLLTAGSVLFDAVFVPGGDKSVATLKIYDKTLQFIEDADRHCKPIAATGAAIELLPLAVSVDVSDSEKTISTDGIVTGPDKEISKVSAEFIKAMMQHRVWAREKKVGGMPSYGIPDELVPAKK